jgi:hypothetical protein
MRRRRINVRSIRAILRNAGVPLSEFVSDVKGGPRRATVGADVYTPAMRGDADDPVIVEWHDGRAQTARIPEFVRAALASAGFGVDAHGIVCRKDEP